MNHFRSALLRGAGIGVLGALAFAASAQAATHHHHKSAAAPAGDSKVEALTQEVETLESRLEAESIARQRLEGEVQTAQSQAGTAQAAADAANAQLQAQIQTIPGVVDKAVAANKPKATWADNTTVSGRVFADFTNIHQSPTPKAINGTGVDIKRAYIGVDHKFNDVWSATLLADLAPNGIDIGTGSGSAGASPIQGSEVVKNAFIQAKFDPAFTVQFGEASMPWIPFVEDLYGYRYVEKTLTDTNKVGNSADWGIFAKGSFAGGLLNYSVAAVDGAGYKNAVRSKGMDFEGRVNVNYMGFVAGVGGYTGKESLNIDALAPTTFHTANRFDAVVAYVNPLFRVGLQYFDATNWKQLGAVASDEQDAYSAFGSFNFTPQISLFARYDWGDPSKKLHSSAKLDYYNIGLQYSPVKVVNLAIVWKHDELRSAPVGYSYADANTTLAPASTGGGARYDEVGLFTEFKF